MKLVHIVGRKNHGKTKLVVELVRELTGRGFTVGTVKHCGRDHELDIPGTDSYRHRIAGGTPAVVVTPSLTAVFRPRNPGENLYNRFANLFGEVDIVVIEGDTAGPGPKIEVWRENIGTEPLACSRSDIVALVTDDRTDCDVPLWPRNDIHALADRVIQLADGA